MIIEPFKSVGILSFTDTRQQISRKIGGSFNSGIKEFGLSKDYFDCFEEKGLFVYYDESGGINAFEFFEGHPVYQGVDLLTEPYHRVIQFLKEIDLNLNVEYNGFTSYKYGIGGNTNDDPESVKSLASAIIVFKEGYYN